MAFEDYFSVQVFLIVLRETLESAIIVSVLLAFLHQSFEVKENKKTYTGLNNEIENNEDDSSAKDSKDTYRFLRIQVWVGGLLGLVCCLIIGSVILSIFYFIGSDLWSVTEHYWEGTFSIIASIIISIMGVTILRVNKMQKKWKLKLTSIIKNSNYLNRAIDSQSRSHSSFRERLNIWSEKYSMFFLPFITTLREGMEAIVFIGGIGINENTTTKSIVISLVLAVIIGSVVGILLYKTGNSMSLQWFLIISTCFLYLVAAGLFSKGVWNFELQRFIDLCDGFDVSETGHGPGSYDITKSVWHVNCCNGELQDDGAFWMIVTAIFGWTNSATYGSVISYWIYWAAIIAMFGSLIYEEKHGYLPLVPFKWQQKRMKKRLALIKLSQDHERDLSRMSVDSSTPLQHQT
ncbi:iron transporter Fth1p [[Candida] jaroonii]|uniref:Iron transporter Fth1p n=1 Tax=[Candida] jaroonii TaxID=467808 RepID=A0ACA9Y3K6_9ASCO|nr:iron transporter Fth1p [[Candida] jaroonii]